jgi:hypothetical protein
VNANPARSASHAASATGTTNPSDTICCTARATVVRNDSPTAIAVVTRIALERQALLLLRRALSTGHDSSHAQRSLP